LVPKKLPKVWTSVAYRFEISRVRNKSSGWKWNQGQPQSCGQFLTTWNMLYCVFEQGFWQSFDLKQDIFLAMTKVLVALYTSNTSLTSDISACSTLSDICDLKTTYASTTIKEYYRLWVVCKWNIKNDHILASSLHYQYPSRFNTRYYTSITFPWNMHALWMAWVELVFYNIELDLNKLY